MVEEGTAHKCQRITQCLLARTEKSIRIEIPMGVCVKQRRRKSSLLSERKAYAKALWSDVWISSMAGAEEQETAWGTLRSLALLARVIKKLLSREMWPCLF